MNPKFVWWLVAVATLLVCSCSKKQPAYEQPQPNMDSVDRSAGSHLDPVKVLHRVISVSNHAEFAFSVPPHQKDARLRGTFRSFTKRGAPDSTSDDTANIDVMVLNDQQLDDFQHGKPVAATYEIDPSHDQRVEWKAPATSDQAQAYHLVFNNSSGGAKTKFVQADFSVTFE